MSQLVLVIGNKNLSSWSFRPWLVMKESGIPFKEIQLPLDTPQFYQEITLYSPSGKVPTLIDGDLHIHESLAICEYLAEKFPSKQLWPKEVKARAVARAISSEMHASFVNLRKNMPMNFKDHLPGKGRTPEVLRDIERIQQIWKGLLSKSSSEGPFLFGHFTIADAMFAPVVSRFRTYDVKLDPLSASYAKMMENLPAFQEWRQEAILE